MDKKQKAINAIACARMLEKYAYTYVPMSDTHALEVASRYVRLAERLVEDAYYQEQST